MFSLSFTDRPLIISIRGHLSIMSVRFKRELVRVIIAFRSNAQVAGTAMPKVFPRHDEWWYPRPAQKTNHFPCRVNKTPSRIPKHNLIIYFVRGEGLHAGRFETSLSWRARLSNVCISSFQQTNDVREIHDWKTNNRGWRNAMKLI